MTGNDIKERKRDPKPETVKNPADDWDRIRIRTQDQFEHDLNRAKDMERQQLEDIRKTVIQLGITTFLAGAVGGLIIGLFIGMLI